MVYLREKIILPLYAQASIKTSSENWFTLRYTMNFINQTKSNALCQQIFTQVYMADKLKVISYNKSAKVMFWLNIQSFLDNEKMGIIMKKTISEEFRIKNYVVILMHTVISMFWEKIRRTVKKFQANSCYNRTNQAIQDNSKKVPMNDNL